jgi:hypothetical protein
LSEVDQPTEEVRRSCEILGLQEDGLTREIIVAAWKKLVVTPQPGVNSDDFLIKINTAKDVLLVWLSGR